jgi:hypothetical protein
MRKILYLRHPAFNSKTGEVTKEGWQQVAALLPIITALFSTATIWTSSEIRAKHMGARIADALGGCPITEQTVLNTVKWEGERGIPGCAEIFREANEYLARNPSDSIVTAILRAKGGTKYLERKVDDIAEHLHAATGDLIVVAHESSVEGLGWKINNLPFGSHLPGGHEIRYVEGVLLREEAGGFRAELVRNPVYG